MGMQGMDKILLMSAKSTSSANKENIGTLADLTTVDKTNLVDSINEVKSLIDPYITSAKRYGLRWDKINAKGTRLYDAASITLDTLARLTHLIATLSIHSILGAIASFAMWILRYTTATIPRVTTIC